MGTVTSISLGRYVVGTERGEVVGLNVRVSPFTLRSPGLSDGSHLFVPGDRFRTYRDSNNLVSVLTRGACRTRKRATDHIWLVRRYELSTNPPALIDRDRLRHCFHSLH